MRSGGWGRRGDLKSPKSLPGVKLASALFSGVAISPMMSAICIGAFGRRSWSERLAVISFGGVSALFRVGIISLL